MDDLTTNPSPHASLFDQVDELRARVETLRGQLDATDRLSTVGLTTAMVAHEINNLLTPVAAMAERALAQGGDARTRAALTLAVDNAHQASAITTALLALTEDRPASGDESCDIGRVVERSLACLGRDLAADGIRVEVAVGDHTTARIAGVALQQVVVNLLLNARQAMLDRGGRLTISARSEARPREQSGPALPGARCSTGNTPACGSVVLEIADTGCGIPAEDRERIFQPFVRRTHSTTEPEGTGLGLAICKRLVEAAGGTIEVHSAVGAGTRFRIALPGGGLIEHKRSA